MAEIVLWEARRGSRTLTWTHAHYSNYSSWLSSNGARPAAVARTPKAEGKGSDGLRRIAKFGSEAILPRFFELGILIKGVDGGLELVGGLLLVFLSPARSTAWSPSLCKGN
jgi:hypothetical protein